MGRKIALCAVAILCETAWTACLNSMLILGGSIFVHFTLRPYAPPEVKNIQGSLPLLWIPQVIPPLLFILQSY